MQEKIRELQNKIRKIAISKTSGSISDEEFQKKKEQYFKQINELRGGTQSKNAKLIPRFYNPKIPKDERMDLLLKSQ